MAPPKNRKPSRWALHPPNSSRSLPHGQANNKLNEGSAGQKTELTGEHPTAGRSTRGLAVPLAAVTSEDQFKAIQERAVREVEATKRRLTATKAIQERAVQEVEAAKGPLTATKSIAGLAAQKAKVAGKPVKAVLEEVFSTDSTPRVSNMAARNRPRPGPVKEDPDEELSMWNQIKKDIEKCSAIQKRAAVVSQTIVEMEAKMAVASPSVEEIDQLQALYRENVKLAEEESRLLKEEPADLIKNIGILSALRTASEKEPQRAPQPSKIRKQKVPKLDMDGAADSPGPSPSVAVSATRLKGSNTARSGSVASTRDGKEGKKIEEKEVGVKIEEGTEGAKGPSAERSGKFFQGAEVAYKQARMKEDGSQWIQCVIVNIIDVGNKKRYEVQDPEPDETGAPGQIYKASAAALIAIPPADAILPDYPVGKPVLARYPETTTFYRAEVTGMKKDVCRLKFEDDQNQEMEVERRFVLDVSSK